MKTVQCEVGHFYDRDKYNECPYCSGDSSIGVTRSLNNMQNTVILKTSEQTDNRNSSSYPATTAVNRDENFPLTMPVKNTFPSTMPIKSSDIAETMPLNVIESGIIPVIAWLVCINGKRKGKDYKLTNDKTFIGRTQSNDICLEYDDSISRESHLIIFFNKLKREFYIDASQSKNNIYVNGDIVFSPLKLSLKDYIVFGNTSFIFVPLCDDNFSWDN